MKCANCGKISNDAANFCRNCGTALMTNEIDATSVITRRLMEESLPFFPTEGKPVEPIAGLTIEECDEIRIYEKYALAFKKW